MYLHACNLTFTHTIYLCCVYCMSRKLSCSGIQSLHSPGKVKYLRGGYPVVVHSAHALSSHQVTVPNNPHLAIPTPYHAELILCIPLKPPNDQGGNKLRHLSYCYIQCTQLYIYIYSIIMPFAALFHFNNHKI